MYKNKFSIIALGVVVMFAVFVVGCSKSDECDIISIVDSENNVTWVRDGKTDFEGTYDKDADVSALNLTIRVSPKASYSPKGPFNFNTGNIKIIVKSQSGETEEFNLKVKQ